MGGQPTVGRLKVTALGATGLKKTDIIGKCDPYLIIGVGSTRQQTPPVKNTLTPTWNQSFWFDVRVGPNGVIEDRMYLRVMDKDKIGKDDTVGDTEVNFAHQQIQPNNPTVLRQRLRPQGELTVEVMLLAAAGVGTTGGTHQSTIGGPSSAFHPTGSPPHSRPPQQYGSSAGPVRMGSPGGMSSHHGDEYISDPRQRKQNMKLFPQYFPAPYGPPKHSFYSGSTADVHPMATGEENPDSSFYPGNVPDYNGPFPSNPPLSMKSQYEREQEAEIAALRDEVNQLRRQQGASASPAHLPLSSTVLPGQDPQDAQIQQLRDQLAALKGANSDMERAQNNNLVPLQMELNVVRAQLDRANVQIERLSAPPGELPIDTFGHGGPPIPGSPARTHNTHGGGMSNVYPPPTPSTMAPPNPAFGDRMSVASGVGGLSALEANLAAEMNQAAWRKTPMTATFPDGTLVDNFPQNHDALQAPQEGTLAVYQGHNTPGKKSKRKALTPADMPQYKGPPPGEPYPPPPPPAVDIAGPAVVYTNDDLAPPVVAPTVFETSTSHFPVNTSRLTATPNRAEIIQVEPPTPVAPMVVVSPGGHHKSILEESTTFLNPTIEPRPIVYDEGPIVTANGSEIIRDPTTYVRQPNGEIVPEVPSAAVRPAAPIRVPTTAPVVSRPALAPEAVIVNEAPAAIQSYGPRLRAGEVIDPKTGLVDEGGGVYRDPTSYVKTPDGQIVPEHLTGGIPGEMVLPDGPIIREARPPVVIDERPHTEFMAHSDPFFDAPLYEDPPITSSGLFLEDPIPPNLGFPPPPPVMVDPTPEPIAVAPAPYKPPEEQEGVVVEYREILPNGEYRVINHPSEVQSTEYIEHPLPPLPQETTTNATTAAVSSAAPFTAVNTSTNKVVTLQNPDGRIEDVVVAAGQDIEERVTRTYYVDPETGAQITEEEFEMKYMQQRSPVKRPMGSAALRSTSNVSAISGISGVTAMSSSTSSSTAYESVQDLGRSPSPTPVPQPPPQPAQASSRSTTTAATSASEPPSSGPMQPVGPPPMSFSSTKTTSFPPPPKPKGKVKGADYGHVKSRLWDSRVSPSQGKFEEQRRAEENKIRKQANLTVGRGRGRSGARSAGTSAHDQDSVRVEDEGLPQFHAVDGGEPATESEQF
eukprot:TRINITY_DN63407_c0_g1_i1.p1 TRINITY_DN63407_c0_g1~~TRINITY_DN63407_c0_g1_i1.p1  ORF type:complete len:1265 (-),score=172.61 TRINITY_DN63407_c0_g1_i1:2249-5686(-)